MIGRRALGQRRIIFADETDGGIAVADSAVDVPKSDLKKYRESLYDTSHLVLIPGERPTYFTVRPLTRRQKDAIDGMSTREACEWIWRCGMISFENYRIQATDGSEYDAPQPDVVTNGTFGSMASERWIDDVNPPQAHLLPIAAMIRRISEAELPLSKPSVPQSGPGTSSAEAETAKQS